MEKKLSIENKNTKLVYVIQEKKFYLDNSLKAEATWKLYTLKNKELTEISIPLAQKVESGEGYIEAVHRWIQEGKEQWVFQWRINTSDQGFSVKASLGLVKGVAKEVVIELPWKLKGNPEEFYSLFPGAVYAHNKADCILYEKYPPRLKDFNNVSPKGPTYTGDFPRFTEESGYELIQQTTDLSTPRASIYHDGNKEGMWLWTSDEYPFLNGFILKKFTDDSSICFSTQFPVIRKRRYRLSSVWEESPDKGFPIAVGKPYTIEAGFGSLCAVDRPEFIAKIARLQNKEELVIMPNPILPFSEGAKLVAEGLNTRGWNEEESYYSEGSNTQIGWVGGIITSYAMLKSKNESYKEKALRNLNFFMTNGISPCGLFYGIYGDSKWYGSTEKTDGLDFAGRFIRRIGDGLFFLLKILEEDMVQEESLKSKSMLATERSLEVFSRMSRKYGQFGSHVDFNTGDILLGGSAAGAIAMACLEKCSKLFARRDWLEDAENAVPYYEKFLHKGMLTGGPGDIIMAADQESAVLMLESFWSLYETTNNERYLVDAIKTADYISTWVFWKDYKLPHDSSHGKLGINPFGLLMASAQNKCATPGFCTNSGRVLLDLYKKTGDRLYIEMLMNVQKAVPQMICRYSGHLQNMPVGAISEDINVGDSLYDRGEFYSGGSWTEVAFCLSQAELPSIYIDSGKNVFVIDHCFAELKGDIIEIVNPTAYTGVFKVEHIGKVHSIELKPLETGKVQL